MNKGFGGRALFYYLYIANISSLFRQQHNTNISFTLPTQTKSAAQKPIDNHTEGLVSGIEPSLHTTTTKQCPYMSHTSPAIRLISKTQPSPSAGHTFPFPIHPSRTVRTLL